MSDVSTTGSISDSSADSESEDSGLQEDRDEAKQAGLLLPGAALQEPRGAELV